MKQVLKILFTMILFLGILPKSNAMDVSNCHDEHQFSQTELKKNFHQSKSSSSNDCSDHKNHCCHSISIFFQKNIQTIDLFLSAKVEIKKNLYLGEIAYFTNPPFHPPRV